jgi:hypothetical protein
MTMFLGVYPSDEFQIKAWKDDGTEQVWTRSKLDIAKSIANQTIEKGYVYAEVRNTHGGHISDPLYEAGTKPPIHDEG